MGIGVNTEKERVLFVKDGEMAFVDLPCHKKLWSGKCGFGQQPEQGRTD